MRPRTVSQYRQRRHARLRKKVQGTAGRPRMSVCFTGKHIYVQFIDDVRGATLASTSTVSANAKGTRPTIEETHKLGALATAKAKKNNITKIIFDHNNFTYHGRVKALADAAREAGLKL